MGRGAPAEAPRPIPPEEAAPRPGNPEVGSRV